MEAARKDCPVKISAVLDWIEREEVGVIDCNEAVQKAVVEWAKNIPTSEKYEVNISVSKDELTAALIEDGIDGVEELVQRLASSVATEAMAWGAISAYQRLSDPDNYGIEIVAD